MDKINKIPSSADLLRAPKKDEQKAMQKTRGITADIIAAAEDMFQSTPAVSANLSSHNHRKKTQKLPPHNFIG